MTMQDPVSGRQYEPSINGIKRWAANELPYGVPLLYGLVGFAVITTLVYGLLSAAAWLFSWTVPGWVSVGIVILGLIWAFGGWQHGQEAESELDLDTADQFEKIDP